MTTRPRTIRREPIHDWPIFAERGLREDIGVVSLELNRQPHENMANVVAKASANLRSAVIDAMLDRPYKLWLLRIGRPVPSSRVALYYAMRYGLWDALESDEVSLPNGPRHEVRIDYGVNSFGLAGSIEFTVCELPLALEATRARSSVCVATDLLSMDPITEVVSSLEGPIDLRPQALLPPVLEALSSYLFVARGFGSFDDLTVGVELFGPEPTLDAVEQSLTRLNSN